MSILLLGSNTSPLTVSLSAYSVFGGRHGAGVVFSGVVTATPIGGVAPYTYSWTYNTGDVTISAVPNNNSTPVFSATLATNETKIGNWQLLVTDHLGTVSPPVYVDIYLEELNYN